MGIIRIPSCPTCSYDHSLNLGEIPDAIKFAGRDLGAPVSGGYLWKCTTCGIRFRFPRLEKHILDGFYRAASTDAWATPSEERVDWALARKHLSLNGRDGRLLDIGCYDGRFLESLNDEWERFGIEVNENAAAKARVSGIGIIGADIENLATDSERFDAITAFDVIEHVENPLAFLATCSNVLVTGGMLIVATGNTSSLPWRLLGSRNLYCVLPEHLAFINPSWCEWAAPRVGLSMKLSLSYRRSRTSVPTIIADLMKNCLYSVSPGIIAFMRRMGIGNVSHPVKFAYPPLWPSAKDHFISIFVKNGP